MKKRENMKKEKLSREAVTERWKAGGMAAALIAAAAVFAVMLQLEKSMLTKYEKGTVYAAAAEIPKGQMITADNLSLYFQEKALDKSCIPESALRSPEQVTGLAAVFDIEQGVLLSEGMFESLDDVLEEISDPVVAGFKAEDLYQVVGGVLRAGDRIHIYSVSEEGEVSLVWSNVYVQEVFDQSGAGIVSGDKVTAAQRINIYLDKKDVETFYSELAGGALRVVKVF
ncbi:MAG: SAF domain-containing protein [Butyrivibrio sp.]|nr:SAF domain-containing protein [Acetatifactor muris]MCM1559725.1 SAF domain-containing protein [Butyrivibrio sp.]